MDKVSADKAGKKVEIPKDKKWEETKVDAIADGEGGVIPVPSGFYYAGGSISTGIVISDKENDDLDNSQKGNQFVWIPATAEAYENAAKYSAKKEDGGKGWSQFSYHTDAANKEEVRYKGKTGWKNPDNQITDAKRSIGIYGGFYVARFEGGVPEDADFYVPSDESEDKKTYYRYEKKNVDTYKPVSKKGNQAWNYISQENAKKVSEAMYNDSSSVTSYLIDSNAWNYICGDIFDKILTSRGEALSNSTNYGNSLDNAKTKYTEITTLYAHHTNGSGWGYSDAYNFGKIPYDVTYQSNSDNRLELATGSSDDFKIFNIYDMAGNLWEWTAEITTVAKGVNGEESEHTYANLRGGCFDVQGWSNPVVQSDGNNYISEYFITYRFSSSTLYKIDLNQKI